MRVRCIKNIGVENLFTVGKIYEAETDIFSVVQNCYRVRDNDGDLLITSKERFEIIKPFKVRCLNNDNYETNLIKGKIYEAEIDPDSSRPEPAYIIQGENGRIYPFARRFEIVSDDEPLPDTKRSTQLSLSPDEIEENRLRALLTRPVSDPYTCSKCGSPKSVCRYH